MPNWCEGTLRVRGKMKDLKRFVSEGILSTNHEWVEGVPMTKMTPLKMEEYEDGERCGFSVLEGVQGAWLKGTRRHFVQQDYIEMESRAWDDVRTLCLEIQAAWGMDATQLQAICKEFSVDMRVYGFECGMEFNQNIEIINGEITKDREVKFDDYEWECICPRQGG